MAALDFMGNGGGIPTTALTEAGKVTRARMEHVWVEAFINYIPSRGAKHVNGKGDTWIKLDPSYKQYSYTQGIDIKTAVPFDAQGFMSQLQSTAMVNNDQGYVTGINSAFVQQAMQSYQAQVQNYFQQNYPNATVGDVLGKKDIVKQEYPYLLGTLPYRTAVKGGTFASIPDSLRHTVTFTVQKDANDDEPLNIVKSLPELAGKKITLSYSPATPQDEAVINSYLPKSHADGTPIQPSEMPTSLPAYLINVKPELRLDGQVVASGSSLNLGGIENFTMNFSSPWISSEPVVNVVIAGTYQGIALDLGHISTEQVQNAKSSLENTKAKLEAQNYTGITKDNLIGDLLYTTALLYHAELGLVKQIAARSNMVAFATWPSEAIFKADLTVSSFFGYPRSVSAGALAMDADKLATVSTALAGNQKNKINFMLQTGIASSALEHLVPEHLFSTPENPAKGISAVKALKLANDQGIPIYTVNQANIDAVLPQLQIDQQVKTDIQNAVNAGKTVTVSKTDISYNGWTGCGYIIIDPASGAGAYMISGNLNGSMIEYYFWSAMLVIALVAEAVSISILAAYFIAFLPEIIAFLASIIQYIGVAYLSLSLRAFVYLLENEILMGLFALFRIWNDPNSGTPNTDFYPDFKDPLQALALIIIIVSHFPL